MRQDEILTLSKHDSLSRFFRTLAALAQENILSMNREELREYLTAETSVCCMAAVLEIEEAELIGLAAYHFEKIKKEKSHG